MPNRGKLVVGSIFVLALALASFAVFWQWQHRGRSAAFWGAETSQLIRGARQTELLVLQPATAPAGERNDAAKAQDSQGSPITIDGAVYHVIATIDLARSAGLIHARHSLTEDASFIWDQPANGCQPKWTHAIRFTQDDRFAILAFDFNCQRIYLVDGARSVGVSPRIAQGFQRIAERAIKAQ